MKSPNEVCSIVGITRKTLRGYVDEGLITPTVTSENGYQHYDDDAIRKVILAKVFQDGGYTRKQTKAIFESEKTQLADEYDKLIEILRNDRKRIDGQIRTVRLLKIETHLSASAKEALESINPVETYQNRNFKSCLDGIIDRLSELSGEIDSYDLDAYLLFWYSLVVIGIVTKHDDGADRIHASAEEAFTNFCLLMNHLDGFSGDFDDLDHKKKVGLFRDFIGTYFQDETLVHEIESVCGDSASKTIASAVLSWSRDNVIDV